MGDSKDYYEQLRGRARHLVRKLNDVLADLALADHAVDEVMKADMDNPGELSPMDAADLRQLLETALFSVRGAERIAAGHEGDVERVIEGN
jgi:hypothetical protein